MASVTVAVAKRRASSIRHVDGSMVKSLQSSEWTKVGDRCLYRVTTKRFRPYELDTSGQTISSKWPKRDIVDSSERQGFIAVKRFCVGFGCYAKVMRLVFLVSKLR